jgi:hypothetical protein
MFIPWAGATIDSHWHGRGEAQRKPMVTKQLRVGNSDGCLRSKIILKKGGQRVNRGVAAHQVWEKVLRHQHGVDDMDHAV